MKICRSIKEIRESVSSEKKAGKSIGLVPTMGALHEGHLSLIRKAKSHSDVVVVSVFVNPTQFGPNEDFNSYPRQLNEDAEICEKEGVDYIFAPDASEMYSNERYIRFEIDELTNELCGKSRPGHFQGVLQVVSKLFNIVKPDLAVFGQKDIQQFIIISRMVKELDFDIEIIMGETQRADDGLALSSRNKYLNEQERMAAPQLQKSLKAVVQKVTQNKGGLNAVLDEQKSLLKEKGFKIDYLSVVSYEALRPAEEASVPGKYIAAGAVYIGRTRLIDNIIFNYKK